MNESPKVVGKSQEVIAEYPYYLTLVLVAYIINYRRMPMNLENRIA